MATLSVTLEHHKDRRYHRIHCGAGRRPQVVYGNFNLRYSPAKGLPRLRQSLMTEDLITAMEARRNKEEELNAMPVEKTSTLLAAGTKFLREVKAIKKKKTFQAYELALRYFQESCGNKAMNGIRREDMLDFRVYLKEEKNLEPRSVFNKFSNIMTFLKANGIRGHELKITKFDWPDYVETIPEIYEPEELAKFFGACEPDEWLIFQTFLQSGFREQEIIFTAVKDVDRNHTAIMVKHKLGWTPKAYRERTVPISASLAQKLVAHGGEGLLFPTKSGQPKLDFLDICKAVAKRAGMNPEDFWLHKFRATAATTWLRAGFDLRTVQAWLGHEDIASTMRYLRPDTSDAVMERVARMWA